jgi:uridine kinase
MHKNPFLIGIAGASGSGKSELASQLSTVLDASVISLDSYYLELGHLSYQERGQMNFDEPAALDSALLLDHISRIAAGEPIDVPEYDFSRHTRAPRTERILPGEFFILEGLFALYWENVRNLLGTRVFVDLPDDICFARRLERDVRDRGRTPESVHEQYFSTVKPMCELHILPTRTHADIVVNGDANLQDSVAKVMARCSFARTVTA